jgi:cbb3-type cytochrome oxidase subunit 1
MAQRFIKIAVLYLALGVTLGVVMGLMHVFTFMPVHAHLNLLGWASLALVGLVYHAYPQAAATRLATIHFWLHNVGLPPLMISLALLVAGNAAMEPVVGISSLVVAAGVMVFVVNVWMTLPAGAPRPAPVVAAAAR